MIRHLADIAVLAAVVMFSGPLVVISRNVISRRARTAAAQRRRRIRERRTAGQRRPRGYRGQHVPGGIRANSAAILAACTCPVCRTY